MMSLNAALLPWLRKTGPFAAGMEVVNALSDRTTLEEQQMRSILIVVIAAQLACAGARADRSSAVDPGRAVAGDAVAQAKPVPAPPNGDPAAVRTLSPAETAFMSRVNDYIALRGKVDNGIPKLTETTDPKKIAERERALGEALIKARASAKPGDIFVPEFHTELVKIIKADFAKRTPAERKALIVELPKGVTVGTNQVYPTTIPLATFPPNLLSALPDLPKDLEYRIIHRHLILRDVRGNYVVDIVRDVFPIPA
jgi:hypothetical protein